MHPRMARSGFIMVAIGLFQVPVIPQQGEVPYNETQAGMTDSACGQLKHEAEAMETAVAEVRASLAATPKGLALFEASQRAWSTYRDSQLKLNDPDEVYGPGNWGTVVPMCLCSTAATMTRQRTQELVAYIHLSEGDVCRVVGPPEAKSGPTTP